MYGRIFLVHLKTVLLTAKHTKGIAIAMMPVCLLTWSDYCGHLYKTPIKTEKDEFTVRFGLVLVGCVLHPIDSYWKASDCLIYTTFLFYRKWGLMVKCFCLSSSQYFK